MKKIFLPIFDDVEWSQEDINVDNLNNLLSKIEPYNYIYKFRYIRKLYIHYKDVIEDYKELDKFNKEKSVITLLSDYQKRINNIVNSCNMDSIIVSSTHLSTYYTLKSLNSNNKKIFVICFDAHSDTCSAIKPAWKGNIFSKLLKENIIDGLIIVSGNRLKKTKDKRILVLKYSSRSINKVKEYLYNNEAEELYFSFDIDVLNTYDKCLTAMEYNSFNVLRHLSSQNLDHIKNVFDLYSVIKKSIKIPNDYGCKNLYKSGFSGITLDEIEEVISSIIVLSNKMNITIGVENNYGNKIFGDVVEYYGYDYKNRTFDYINCFVNKIERSIKNEKTFC